eukprot:CAMPEP_0172780490 /NCGR_PEP_ID=MMETSP1074-20121228/202956_1 /TAXON_ID=2916 /ORGANISM="Ceratium fusus, Strain PA161109" /LENGTH=260 /DNA_ID=CAMNT_0013617467 /DNA_START=91 /DNA_END=874 /DNA_ORIENTATION=-
MLVLATAHVAVHVSTALKIEARLTADLEHEFKALHVKVHSIVAGLREQLRNDNGEMRKAPVLPMLIEFQQKLQRTLSDTVYMKDKHAALAELTSVDNSVERLITPYNNWVAAHRSYKLATDSGILLEETTHYALQQLGGCASFLKLATDSGILLEETASSLDTRLSKMEKAFQAKKNSHEKRLGALRILARVSASKPNKDALQREEESFNKLSQKWSKQHAKMRSALDAVKKKDTNFVFAFMRAVHDATVNDDLHASAVS